METGPKCEGEGNRKEKKMQQSSRKTGDLRRNVTMGRVFAKYACQTRKRKVKQTEPDAREKRLSGALSKVYCESNRKKKGRKKNLSYLIRRWRKLGKGRACSGGLTKEGEWTRGGKGSEKKKKQPSTVWLQGSSTEAIADKRAKPVTNTGDLYGQSRKETWGNGEETRTIY